MKKIIIPLLLLAVLLCACSGVPDIDVEGILSRLVESIDWEQLQQYLQQGADALVEKYPALKPLTNRDDLQQLLKEHGLKLIGKYLESTDPETQQNAQKLGAIIKILSPDLSDEVDTVLGG